MEKTVVYNYTKSTKNTHMFTNEELGVYYLPKSVLGDTAPQTIEVTLKSA